MTAAAIGFVNDELNDQINQRLKRWWNGQKERISGCDVNWFKRFDALVNRGVTFDENLDLKLSHDDMRALKQAHYGDINVPTLNVEIVLSEILENVLGKMFSKLL